jgi:homoserine kinase
MKKEIKVFAPASVTNVTCGFDIMGFALNFPGDELELKLTGKPGVIIKKITGDNGKLPLDVELNTAGLAVLSLANYLNYKKGIEIILHKKISLGSGLGSSAASAVAGVFAFNEIIGRPLTKSQLLPFALEGEKLTCGGTPHADNVAAALLGGFIIVRSLNPLDVFNIEFPENLFCTVAHPKLVIKTAEARRILKNHVPLSDAVQQWGNVAGLTAGLINKDYELIKKSLHDVIVEPARAIFIPGFYEVKNAAINTGALGCGISGSGPSIFALSTSKIIAKKVGEKMQDILTGIGTESNLYISKINSKGPKVLK